MLIWAKKNDHYYLCGARLTHAAATLELLSGLGNVNICPVPRQKFIPIGALDAAPGKATLKLELIDALLAE